MPQSLICVLVHIVFSTKKRAPFITPEIEPELHAYLAGTANNLGARSLAVNGTADHVHMLVSLSKTISIASLLAEIKKSSSRWIKTRGPGHRFFGWQTGYGAFSIGQSSKPVLMDYIARQKEKRRRWSFQAEFRGLLRRYGVEFDERYVWD